MDKQGEGEPLYTRGGHVGIELSSSRCINHVCKH